MSASRTAFTRDVQVGQTLPATVTRVMPYGAFAKVTDGVEGLVHVSEPVDTERRRLSLSARLADRT